MTVRTSPWPNGVPCWADVSTPDVGTASELYRAVLGWTIGGPDDAYGGYVLAEVGGHPAAGLGPAPPEQTPAWTLYLATDDVDATSRAAAQAGGTVLLEPGDVGALGRVALLADPSGAAVGLWQAGAHIGASHAPGGMSGRTCGPPAGRRALLLRRAVRLPLRRGADGAG